MKRKLLLFAVILTAILCFAAVASAVTCPFCHEGTLTEIEPIDSECCAISCDTCEANNWAFLHTKLCSKTVCPCCGKPGLGGHQIDPNTGECPCGYTECINHDWSNKDGICANCGEICRHPTFTDKICDTCGYKCECINGPDEWLYEDTGDGQNCHEICPTCHSVGSTVPHSFSPSDGITCQNCGYVCTHKGMTYRSNKNGTHMAYCTCSKYRLGVTEDCDIVDGKCTKCGYVACAKHEWEYKDGDGVCKNCGTVCVHPNSDLIYEPADETKHSVICDTCGYKLDPETHDFIDGVCDACEYKCTHPKDEWIYPVTDDPAEHAVVCNLCDTTIDSEAHEFDLKGHCGKCDYQCDHPEEARIIPVVEDDPSGHAIVCNYCDAVLRTEPHNFNENGHCADCDYQCPHNEDELIYPVTDDPAEHAVVCNVCGAALDSEAHEFDLNGHCGKCDYQCDHPEEARIIPVVEDDPSGHAIVCNYCDAVLRTEPHNFNENGHCPDCDYQCPHTKLNDGICVNCGYQVEIKVEVYTAIDKTPAVVESETVSEAKLGIDYNVLQRRTDLFTDAEQRKFLAQSKAAVWFDIKDAPALSEADAAALAEKLGKEPLGTLSLNIKLMKQFEKEEPVEVTGCDKLPVNLKLKPESIPAGATGLLAIIDGVEEPIECTFNAETGEVTFETDVFGNITFAFI